MEKVSRYRSLEAFCRHRARVVGEDAETWRERAEMFSRLAAVASRSANQPVDEEKSATADD